MSNFVKQQLRKSKQKERSELKKRYKAVHKIMEELDKLAITIGVKENGKIDDNNIEEIASKYSDIKIEGFEKLILLSKLEHMGKINKEDILKDEDNKDI